MMTFRFDDVCINADMVHINHIVELISEKFPDSEIIFAISPLVHDTGDQRVFDKVMNALSDYRKFYLVDKCGIPVINTPDIKKATHGLIHVDHRLLSYETQEMSILISASLTGAKVFVPPFNKWNKYTESICKEHNIELIKFEDGWKCMEYEKFDKNHKLWYVHAREMTIEQVKNWLK